MRTKDGKATIVGRREKRKRKLESERSNCVESRIGNSGCRRHHLPDFSTCHSFSQYMDGRVSTLC